MRFYLAKTLDKMKMYGPIYDLVGEPEDRVEEFLLEEDENEWLLDNLVDDINAECDTLLDDGDYDYIDSEKCNNLSVFLENIDPNKVPEKYKRVVEKLLEYSKRAAEYGTGMAIDL